jgi:hypothetical protein
MPLTHHPEGNRRWPWRRFSHFGLLLLLGVTVIGAAREPPAQTVPSLPPMQPTETGAPAAAVVGSMDEALRLIGEARQAYRGVRDYTCRMIKRERVNGRLQPENVILLAVRTDPFSVDMRWQLPQALAGQEACYVAGRYDGKMRARAKGLLGAVGFLTLDVNDPKARANSRHPITDAGIGHLIDEFAVGWEQEQRWGQTTVLGPKEYVFDGRHCLRVEMTHPPGAPAGRYQHYRDVVYFDKQTHLPVRMEAYDWPRRPGDTGDLLEMYSYAGLRPNVGLGDEIFNH